MTPVVQYIEDSAGYRVAYSVHGAGPLLICPAWWVSHVEKDWRYAPFRNFFARLGEHFRVVRYDRPGVGLSDRNVPQRSLDDEVKLLAAIVDATADHNKISLLAISCGAPAALTYAAGQPHRLERICFYGAYLDGADIAIPAVQGAMIAMVQAHWGLGSRTLADVFLPGQCREQLDALSKQQRESATAEKAAELLRLTYEMNASGALKDIDAELCVVHRTGDRAIPSCAGRRLAAAIPNTPFVSLDGRVHPPWIDGEDVLQVVIPFLSGTGVDRSLSTPSDPGPGKCRLDAANRELITPDKTSALTPLEFRVMQYLLDAAGRVVTRDELLERIWNSMFSGSNKVDAIVRTLRKKLGCYAPSIETVTGHGYRFRRWSDER